MKRQYYLKTFFHHKAYKASFSLGCDFSLICFQSSLKTQLQFIEEVFVPGGQLALNAFLSHCMTGAI